MMFAAVLTPFADLAEHTGTLVSVIGTLFFLTIGLIIAIYKIAMNLKADILKMIDKVDGRCKL